jgi:flagellar hook-associated protein 2
MGITAPGIGSSLDVNAIVSQLMAVERQPLALLERRESDYQSKLSAYGTLKGALSTFQTAMKGLADAAKFEAITASPEDPSLFTASANGKAVPGTYSVEIEQLAQQQKIRSEGYASTSSVVGSGKLTIQYGTYDNSLNTFTLNSTKAAQAVTIDPSNSSLSGIRDAINAASIGVNATIINDGSSNRLVLTAKDAGAANSIRIMVNDDDGANGDAAGLSQLAFDPTATGGNGKNLTQVQTAQDAKLEIDGIAISKPSNTITDAIEGVTLNLLESNPGSTTTLNVARDGASIKTSVEAFVKAFNTVNQTLSDLSSYNAGTKKGAILQGDSAALSIQSWLRSTVTGAVGSASEQAGSLASLSQIGVSFQKNGSLAVDAAKLQAAIDGNFEQISGLFMASAKPTDSFISYEGASDKTTAGRYSVAVTQLATQGVLTGSQVAGLAISTGINDRVDITADGILASVTLSAGTYASADALAAELQSKLNGNALLAEAGIEVAVAQSGGVLSIMSARYGSASGITLSGGNGGSDLFGTSPVSTAGLDVAGSIGGVAATGSGRILTAATGSHAEGLRLAVEGGAPGGRGSVDFSRGYADQLSRLVEDLLADDGLIAARVDGINASIKDIDRRQEDFMRRLNAVEARYRRQFSALDAMLSSLNQTSQFLQQQLASLPKINSQT